MVDVKYALEVLQIQMESGYQVAHERHCDLRDVRDEIEIKLSFLFEIGGIDKEEYFSMMNYVKRVYKEERRKRNELEGISS